MFGLSTIAIQAIVAGVIAIAAFSTGWEVKGWKDDAAQLAAVSAAVAKAKQDAEANYQMALEAAQKTEEVRVVYRTITKTVDRWRDRPVAHNVCLDPDGVRLGNDVLRGQAAAGPEPHPAVPAPDGGPGDGRSRGAAR